MTGHKLNIIWSWLAFVGLSATNAAGSGALEIMDQYNNATLLENEREIHFKTRNQSYYVQGDDAMFEAVKAGIRDKVRRQGQECQKGWFGQLVRDYSSNCPSPIGGTAAYCHHVICKTDYEIRSDSDGNFFKGRRIFGSAGTEALANANMTLIANEFKRHCLGDLRGRILEHVDGIVCSALAEGFSCKTRSICQH